MSTALIVVDIQNDYFPNGKMELVKPDEASKNAAKVLEWFRENNEENIFHIQHIANDPSLGFFLPETEGAEINDAVKPLKNETVITKHFPNSFLQTKLDNALKENEITDLIVVGMMTHMCIDATVRAGVDLGYSVTLLEDACASREVSYGDKAVPADYVHHAFIGALNGMYCKVTSTEQFLSET